MEGSSQKNKRCRSTNFTKEEELDLVSLVGKFSSIIENKESNKLCRNEKVIKKLRAIVKNLLAFITLKLK